jgi:tRNA threonylcarbamoyladenosine biosynthesis protein TsaB
VTDTVRSSNNSSTGSELVALAIDTSSAMSSVALSRGGAIKASLTLTEVRQHSQIVFEHIEALLSLARIAISEIDLFAAVTGPGSFTGLRIGLAAIEGIAAALNQPVVGVTTFDASARAAGITGVTMTLVDAGRGDVFMGLRRVGVDGLPRVLGDDYVGPLDHAISIARTTIPQAEGAYITGSACNRQNEEISLAVAAVGIDITNSQTVARDPSSWILDSRPVALAPAVAELATRTYLSGLPSGFGPYYLKPSDAEAKWKTLATQT